MVSEINPGMEGNGEENKRRPDPVERFLTIMIDPAGTFKDIVERPDFAIPVVLAVLTALLGIPVAMHSVKNLPPQPGMPPALMSPALAGGIAAVSALVMLLIWWPVRALIFMGLGAALGSRVDFKKSLAVAGYLNYSAFISSLISAITVLALGSPVMPGLGMGLSPEQLATPRGVLLTNLNITSLIYIFLSTFSLSELWRTSRARALAATVIMWALVLAASAGLAKLGAK
ncbi:MAG TPA: YIP1 family protein [Firmicutes bacterium]|nr:YIP1 family protein [Bacillota bacterium]